MKIAASIVCECGETIVIPRGDNFSDLAYKSAWQAIGLHATKPHTAHRVAIVFADGEEETDGYAVRSEDLRITCIADGCADRAAARTFAPATLEARCPIELVAAFAIAFHASHEGHPLLIEWGRYRIESPVLR